jgi:hypothetical protein
MATHTKPRLSLVPANGARMRFFRYFAHYAGVWLLVSASVVAILSWLGVASFHLFAVLVVLSIMCAFAPMLLGSRSPIVIGTPLIVGPPVCGPWTAFNSPASKVPSHRTHGFGQTYAIDLVFSPSDNRSNEVRRRTGFRPPEDFPGFGEPIFAAAEGVVVCAHNGKRDHKSRSSRSALLYMRVIEGFARSLGPPSWVLGNHLIIRLSDGSHLLYAHLRRGSLRFSVGDQVRMGDVIAACGNSGNTTRPHLHIQRQDVASVLNATGLAWAIEGAGDGGTPGFPKNGQRTQFGSTS